MLHGEGDATFPTGLLACTALRDLTLGASRYPHNQFGALPPELFQCCSALQRLRLLNCGVTAVPPEVTCAAGLTELQLLTAKPAGEAAAPQVKLPHQLTTLTSLARLELSSDEVPACSSLAA